MSSRPRIRLYSASPRRRELLDRIGIPYVVDPVDVDETIPGGLNADAATSLIAEKKLTAGISSDPEKIGEWGLAADTLVEIDGSPLGKPGSADEAEAMLRALSGRGHAVHTAMAIHTPGDTGQSASLISIHTTLVWFRDLSARDLRYYLASDEWRGAAGGYRIQGMGAVLVDRIEGLWSTVVGLPLGPLYGMLAAVSYPLG